MRREHLRCLVCSCSWIWLVNVSLLLAARYPGPEKQCAGIQRQYAVVEVVPRLRIIDEEAHQGGEAENGELNPEGISVEVQYISVRK